MGWFGGWTWIMTLSSWRGPALIVKTVVQHHHLYQSTPGNGQLNPGLGCMLILWAQFGQNAGGSG